MGEIAENLADIRVRVAEAAKRSGRAPDEVELLVVTKTWPAEIVREVVEEGQILLGENKVQEALAKAPLLPGNLAWHLIGPLQRNKIRKALPLFKTIHGISSLRLAEGVNRVAKELGLFPKVFLQVNIGEEERKSGFLREELVDDLESLLSLDTLEILGLMTIPPIEKDVERARNWFAQLRSLRDELEERGGVRLPDLSMGMSHDFELAIEEGSTIVRVGSAIFGQRARKEKLGEQI